MPSNCRSRVPKRSLAAFAAIFCISVAHSCFVTAFEPRRLASRNQRHQVACAAGAAGPIARLPGDIAALLTAPYRYLRLASITKEVAKDAVERFRKKASSGGSAKSGAAATLKAFLPTYMKSHVIARTSPEVYRQLLSDSLKVLIDSVMSETPYDFKPYHEAVRGPDIDHYAWGNNFFRSMVKFRNSRVVGLENVQKIKQLLDAGSSVVLLANHQTEADPQVVSLLLEREGYEEVAKNCIFVAGHKVTTDRLAIPFSMGRNLLTIFSKKYLDTFTEDEKAAKSARNQETVSEMQRLMKEGGNIFWVAPSGGRDRKDPESERFVPAKFDASSVGLFVLLAQKAGKSGAKTHFFPLAMYTHGLVPPPDDTKASVGEARSAARASVALNFGPELVVEELGGRKKFPAAAEIKVNELYKDLEALM